MANSIRCNKQSLLTCEFRTFVNRLFTQAASPGQMLKDGPANSWCDW